MEGEGKKRRREEKRKAETFTRQGEEVRREERNDKDGGGPRYGGEREKEQLDACKVSSDITCRDGIE